MVEHASDSEPVSAHENPPQKPRSKKPSAYVFDSNGDTRIILSTYMTQAFKWDADKIWIKRKKPTRVYCRKKNREKEKGKGVESSPPTTPLPQVSPVTSSTSLARTADASSIDEVKVDFPETSPDSTNLQTQDWEYGEICVTPLGKIEFRMLVSGKHLELASSIFKTMVTGPFAEGNADSSGLRRITASDWDPEAFKIVLAIMHGYHRDVPKTLDLEMLVKVAMVVDYYDCLESIELYADIWLEALKSELPTVYGRRCILYIFISWVFLKPITFRDMTRLALMHSKKLIEADDFPIPADILEEIDLARQSAIADIYSAIYELLDCLQEGQECSFECSSMLLGILLRAIRNQDILDPRNAPPFDGFSIESTKEMINGLQKPVWYKNSGYSRDYCCIQDKLSISLAKVESSLRVFDLQDFQGTKDRMRV